MHADYPKSADACAAVSECVLRDFPDAILEVTFHVRGQEHAQHHVQHGHDLGPILLQCTRAFPGARVYYTPHHPYGLICIMECHCYKQAPDPATDRCACDHTASRSTLAIIVLSRDNKPQLAGNRKPPVQPRRPWRAEELD